MAYYGGRNNGKPFLRAMIEPSVWSSSDGLNGCITTAYSFSRDAEWLIENFCKSPISDLSDCLASKVSSEFLFEGQKWKLEVWLNYENKCIELNLLRKGPSCAGNKGNVEISFGLKSVEGEVETFEWVKYNMFLPCNDWTPAVTSRSLLRSRLHKKMESLQKGNGLIVYCMMRLVEEFTYYWHTTLLDEATYIDSKSDYETASDENVDSESDNKAASDENDKNKSEEKNFTSPKVDSKSDNETASDESGKNKSEERNVTFPKVDSKSDKETASAEDGRNKSEERKFTSPKVDSKSDSETTSDENGKNKSEERNFTSPKVDSKSDKETASAEDGRNKSEERNFTSPKVDSKSDNETASDENGKNKIEERNFTSPKVDSKSGNETSRHESAKTKSEEGMFTSPKALVTLSQNLKDLYLSRKGCDVTIKVKSESFSAHRAILNARIPALASVLPENTLESETGIVSVEDCDPKAFEVFLMFVYTGTTENLSTDNVIPVYYLANKYDLLELKDECIQCMMTNLTMDNIYDAFCLASSHR